jgi:hypothetical protein
MGAPLVTPADLALLLNDDSINEARAAALITDAQQACEAVIAPIPDSATYVVKRVALRAYESAGARSSQYEGSDASYMLPGSVGAVYLTQADRVDLLGSTPDDGSSGRGGAFSIDILPAGYLPPQGPFPLSDDILDEEFTP